MSKNKNKNNNFNRELNSNNPKNENEENINENMENDNNDVINNKDDITDNTIINNEDYTSTDDVDIDNTSNNDETTIKVIDDKNKPISEEIEKEEIKSLGIEKEVHSKNNKLKQAKNGEYYEIISDEIGMWSRTGEPFKLSELN